MKISNKFILDQLYFGDPKITPLTLGWLEYTAKVKDIITEEFRKEIGAEPIKGSSLELRIPKASKNFAKIARKKFKKHSRNYKRTVEQHYFKATTHIPLRQKKAPKPAPTSSNSVPSTEATPGTSSEATPGTNTDASPPRQQGPTLKPFQSLGRTQKAKRVKDLKVAASGDVDLLVAAASSAAKNLDMNRHFIFKKIDKDPELAEDLKRFIENDSIFKKTRVVFM